MRRVLAAGSVLLAANVGGVRMATAGDMRRVQFVVVVPDNNVRQPQQVYLSCSRDGWPEPGRAIPRVAPGVYSGELEFEAGLMLEYKFTRAGTWASVEKAADGHEVPNRLLLIDPLVDEQVAVHIVGSWANLPAGHRRRVDVNTPGGQAEVSRKSTLTGDIRYHYRFFSPQFKNERTIMVYLPPSYDSHPRRRYPVLYMQDGNNVFDAATSFAGVEWGADETAQRLIEAGQIEPLIIVAIYNDANRIDEYTPFRDSQHGGGQGDKYLQFLTETVKPFIDKTYRTRVGRENTGIAGSSLGGLISLYAVFARPEVFGRAAAMSPTLGWADRAVFDYVRAHVQPQHPRLWIDVGTAEGHSQPPVETSAYVQACRDMAKLLATLGFKPERELHLEVVEGARHHEHDWAARFDRVLRFLYPPTEAEQGKAN